MATRGHPFPPGISFEDLGKCAVLKELAPAYPPWSNRSFTTAVTCSPDGEYLAWSRGDTIVSIIPWKIFKNKLYNNAEENEDDLRALTKTINCGDIVHALSFGLRSGDRKEKEGATWFRYKVLPRLVLATGHKSGKIRIWNVIKGDLIYQLLDHTDVIRDLRFSPDGSMFLLSASLDGSAKVWDLNDDGNMVKTIKGINKWTFSSTWSPNANLLCITGDSRTANLYEGRQTYRPLRKLEGHIHGVISCAFSPDGALLATGSSDTTVIVWDPYTGQMLNKYGHMYPTPSPIFAGGHNGASIKSLCFSRNGRHLVTAAEDSYLRVWDIFDDTLPVVVGQTGETTACLISPEANIIITGDSAGKVTFHSAPSLVPSLQHLCRMAVRSKVKSPDVKLLQLPPCLKQYLLYNQE